MAQGSGGPGRESYIDWAAGCICFYGRGVPHFVKNRCFPRALTSTLSCVSWLTANAGTHTWQTTCSCNYTYNITHISRSRWYLNVTLDAYIGKYVSFYLLTPTIIYNYCQLLKAQLVHAIFFYDETKKYVYNYNSRGIFENRK